MTVAALAIVVAIALASCAATIDSTGRTRTYFGFTLGIESAPPPPPLVFSGDPRYDDIEDSEVRVVECPDPGSDLFVYGGAYYLYSAGFWYRSDRYDGPYAVLEVRRVPRPVLIVPERHWHHRPRWDSEDRHDRGDRDDRGRS
jgi:hypothetical protein